MNILSHAIAPREVLNVVSVSKHYPPQGGVKNGEKIEVLKNINMTVHAGETLAIVGSSGSGKSTLLSLLAGLDHVSSGRIDMVGTTLASLSENDLAHYRARHLGMIFQRFHLLPHLNALENIALPLDLQGVPQSEVRAMEALSNVQLSHRAHHAPSQLSGGECQRVAIARALVTKPALILADEPTGNLDDDHANRVAELLFNNVSQTQVALILVTHNMSLAQQCSRILRLYGGVLTEE